MKSILKKIFLQLKGDIILRAKNRTPRVVFWHGVDEIVDPIIEAESFTTVNFEKQINYLRKNFEIISIDEFYKRYTKNTFTNNEVVLTFDDGYLNNLTIVKPLLKKYNLPFTVFISTHNISKGELFPTSVARLLIWGSNIKKIKIPVLNFESSIITEEEKKDVSKKISDFLKNEKLETVKIIVKELIENISTEEYISLRKKYSSVEPMNWDHVKKILGDGVTVGSHCDYHICCHENQSKEDITYQITNSKNIIEEKLGVDCHFFAYPNGDFTSFSNQCVQNAGYLMGFSTSKEKITSGKNNTSAIPRISLPSHYDTFRIIVNLYP